MMVERQLSPNPKSIYMLNFLLATILKNMSFVDVGIRDVKSLLGVR